MKLYESLTAVLQEAGSRNRSIRFINGDSDESIVSFAELWRRAALLLGSLQARGLRPHDELVIFTRSNESFVVAFWAAILGGIVPVPVAVGISDEHRLKLFRILTRLRHVTLFTETGLLARLAEFAERRDRHDVREILERRTLLESDARGDVAGEVYEPSPDDIAFIQYSSGSTSDPKGVCLTHRNLTTNIRAIVEGGGWTDQDQSLSWMPLTHDMGLIGFHLSVLAAQMNHAVMDTSLFVRRPLLWMSRASELEATQLCSPNFGFKHFLNMFLRKGADGMDLSSVKLIMNGAEPISWELCEQFMNALEPYGLKRSAMFPVYGLAEATVAVSFPPLGSEYSRIVVNRHSLRIGEAFELADEDDDQALSFVKVGSAVRDCQVRISDDSDAVLATGVVGNIQVCGANVTRGLYNDNDAREELFTADGWLRTGDCGVMVDGSLVITGRSKDIIIVNGQNYYPHDLEEVIAGIEDLDLGKVVVSGASRRGSPTEELLVFLLYRQDIGEFAALAHKVRATVGTQTGLEVDHVIPVVRIPKTTSGKMQRGQLAQAYLEGEFDDVLHSLEPAADETPTDLAEDSADPLILELEQICRDFAKDRVIGPDDNLFEVGVSSLTLTEIILAIDERHPGRVDISDLFDYPTIRQLAAFLRR